MNRMPTPSYTGNKEFSSLNSSDEVENFCPRSPAEGVFAKTMKEVKQGGGAWLPIFKVLSSCPLIKCESKNGTNFQHFAEQLLFPWEIGRLGAGMKKRLETGAADQVCPLWPEMEKVYSGPVDAMTSYHMALKEQKFIFLTVWRPEI